jgi:hypothetical protein
VLRGSHKCGRIEHKLVAGQTGADTERVDLLKQKLPLEYVEMNPGRFSNDFYYYICAKSEWVSDCCLTPTRQFFSYISHGEKKLIFNEMLMGSAVYKTKMLSWISIVLAY